jgi:hypothetical protein
VKTIRYLFSLYAMQEFPNFLGELLVLRRDGASKGMSLQGSDLLLKRVEPPRGRRGGLPVGDPTNGLADTDLGRWLDDHAVSHASPGI